MTLCGMILRALGAFLAKMRLALVVLFFVLPSALSATEMQPDQRDAAITAELEGHWAGWSEPQKFAGLKHLIRLGKPRLAGQFLQRITPTAKNRMIVLFYRGVIAKHSGALKESAAIFRAMLAQDPKMNRVRLELAHTLFLMKEDTSARHHFDLLMASGSKRSLQGTAQGFIDAMDKRKKWHLNAYATLAPSTNMNRGTDNNTIMLNGLEFEINEAGKRKSGIGLHGGVTGGGRIALSDKVDLVAAVGGHLKKYQEQSFDDVLMTGSFGPRFNMDKGHIALYGTASHRWYGQEAYGLNFGSRLNIGYRWNNRNILNSNVIWQRKNHEYAHYRDSDYFRVDVRNDFFLNSHSFIRVLAGVSQETTQREHLDYQSWNAGLGYYKELPFGISLYGEVQYSAQSYEGDYPGSRYAREDAHYDLTLHLTKRDWNIMGYAPALVYNYALNESNVQFNDYDAHNMNLTLSKKF